MKRGTQFGIIGAVMVVLLSVVGCTSRQDEIRASLGASQRGEARASLERALPRSLGDKTARIDMAWTDHCGHATNAGLFQPATGTSCAISGVAVYTLGSVATPAEAVRAAATALRTSGLTSDDVAAGRISSNGAVAGFDDHGTGMVGIGDSTRNETFVVTSVDGSSALTDVPAVSGGVVVAAEPGLGTTGRRQALRDSRARYVLVVTHNDEYFRSSDNATSPNSAPRPSVPPCYSRSDNCVGG